MSDTAGPDAVKSTAMLLKVALFPPSDDGSPIPVFRLSSKPGVARLRLLSGLRAGPADEDARRAEARRIITEARRRSWAERRDAQRAFNRGMLSTGAHYDVFAPDANAPPLLDVMRIRWNPKAGGETLLISHWSIAETGARATTWGADNFHLQGMTKADASRRQIWKDHRLNLGALRAFNDLTHALGAEVTISESWAELNRQEEISAFNAGDMITGEIDYYPFDAVQDLLAQVTRKERAGFPWHKGDAGPELSIGLKFSAPGEPQAAKILFFTDDGLSPTSEAPLVGSQKTLKERLAQAFRLLAEIEDARKTINQLALEFRNASSQDPARAARIDRTIGEQEDAVNRKLGEFAAAYTALVEFVAARKETILEGSRKLEQAAERRQRLTISAEAIKHDYTPVSRLTTTLAEHLTKVPVAFTVKTLSRRGDKARLEQTQTGPAGEIIFNRALDLFEQQHDVPEGLCSIAEAGRTVFGGEMGWLPLQTYVALSQDIGLKSETPGVQYITAGDLFRRIRPSAAAKIAKNGLNDWWKTSHGRSDLSATDALEAALRFLSGIVIPHKKNDEDSLLIGLLSVTMVTKNRRGEVRFGYEWHNALRTLIVGDEKEGLRPSYMVTNHRALFSYGRHAIHTAPHMQVLLESMAHAAAMTHGDVETEAGALEIGTTPGGDHMRVGALVERLHLNYDEKPSNIERRVLTTLDAIQEAGVIQKYSILNNSSNFFQKKIRITMSGDYLVRPALIKAERDEKKLRRSFEENPFEPLEIGPKPGPAAPKRRSPRRKIEQ